MRLFRVKTSFQPGYLGRILEEVAILLCRLFIETTFNKQKENNSKDILVVKRKWAIGNNICESTESFIRISNEGKNLFFCELENNASVLNIINFVTAQEMRVGFMVIDVRFIYTNGAFYCYPNIISNCIRLSIFAYVNGIKLVVISPDYDDPGDQMLAHILTFSGGLIMSCGQIPELVRKKVSEKTQRYGPIPMTSNVNKSKSYNKDALRRNIDVFVGGSIYGERKYLYGRIVKELTSSGLEVFFAEKKDLSYEDYIKVLSSSKLTVVSALHSSSNQWNSKFVAQGKIAEAAALGVVPVTQRNQAIDKWYRPYIEYQPFSIGSSSTAVVKVILGLVRDEKKLEGMSEACRERSKANVLSYSKLFML